ncbi:MAG: hypothetical protein JO163_00870, partial [Methylobacteriaceae bacterium]|nr:hypothetical protein [Methylobacteriaceae bacterium]
MSMPAALESLYADGKTFLSAGQVRRIGETGNETRVSNEGEDIMTDRPFTAADLETLRQWDTPTICNGLELVVPQRRAVGFTVEPMVAVDRKLKPIVGLARTGLIRARRPAAGRIPPREEWYDYVAAGDLPTIAVIQDIDDRPGYGA